MKASKDLDDYRKRINLLEMALFKSKSRVGMTRFDEIDEDIAVVLDPHAASDSDILDAARDCPMNCIHLWDDTTKQKVFPPE